MSAELIPLNKIAHNRCGRPLTSKRSQRRGYGPGCDNARRYFKQPIPIAIIYLEKSCQS